MLIECVALLTNSADGKYVNGVTKEPVPGMRFSFRPAGVGGVVPNGVYSVKGQLEEFTTRGGGKMLIVNGSAEPVTVTYAPVNGAGAGSRK